MDKIFVDTLIFDFDGVLVETGPDIAGAVNYTLGVLGLNPLPTPVIISYIGGGAEAVLRRCLSEKADALLVQAVPVFVQRYQEYCCVESRLYPGAVAVLEHYAKADKRMTIATQKVEAITHRIMDALGIASYFDYIIGAESVVYRKPHPESVLKILDHTQTPASRAIIFGDTASYIQAVTAAGIYTCGVSYGYGSPAEIEAARPDLLFQALIQMTDWVI
jgi:phosphoglycolate phosphatase